MVKVRIELLFAEIPIKEIIENGKYLLSGNDGYDYFDLYPVRWSA